ncbi:MAG: single-stranded-DNA-specific exonuclease RecJ [Gemmatimonadetes bacterium]|nr:single-stranded-DNA-specific exonuclease RecJ [Gemmatimonadota bacterium]MYH20584.1 single-stranded-DNA-specific exonuclease RecJ [Gemmatimonadota bacterium]
MNSRWVLLDEHPQVPQMMELINVPRVIAQILLNRGVTTFDDARYFLKPTLEDLHSPFLMADMDLAVERIHDAIQSGEHIMVFGDYDVDGTTATTLLYLTIKLLTERISSYIPNRMTDGYGLSIEGLEEAKSRGVTLILAVDCGITANAEVELAREMGIDVVIIDHHVPGDTLPNSVAILNPKRDDCEYPFKELCGVGLAYKVAQALAEHVGLPENTVYTHMDLVALGTTADIVPLRDENRVLTKYGLDMMQQTHKSGLQALLDVAGLREKELSTGHMLFLLAPRINAAGRMGDATRVVDLLITEDQQKAAQLAEELNVENKRRRKEDTLTFEAARDIAEKDPVLRESKGLVLASDTWHPGIIGIVASRMVEAFNRPVVMISTAGEKGRGSARTVGDFHLYNAIKECSDLLIQFGGHHHAAGLSIEKDRIDEFRQRFNEVVAARATPADFIPKLEIDSEIELDEVTPRMVKLMKMIGPFGPANHHPVLVSRNLSVVGKLRTIGMEKKHLRFRVRQKGRTMDAIGFGMAHFADRLNDSRDRLDLAYTLEENTFRGETSLQMRIKDIQLGTV